MEQLDLGARLRRAREARNIALKDIAVRTKISAAALDALERNDYSRLPGGIFSRAFVRAYALEIGLDADAIVAEFLEKLRESEAEEAARLAARRPEVTPDDREFLERQRRAVRLLRVALVVVVVAVLALVIWQVRRYWPRPAATPAPVPAASVAPPPSESPAPTSVTTPATGAEVAPPPADGPAPEAAPVAAPAPVATSASNVAASGNGFSLELVLSADCWISVSVDGKAPASQLFRAGERRSFQAERDVWLDVGNAGAVEWLIDGRPAKALGREGVHLRTHVTRENRAEFLR